LEVKALEGKAPEGKADDAVAARKCEIYGPEF
jgi:hypothetical protein